MFFNNAEWSLPLFVSWIKLIIPQPCHNTFFIEFDFLNIPCLKVTISKCLGYSIIVGSSVVTFPQIFKILRAHSGQGISVTSVTFELVAISSSLAYSYRKAFPFSTYGEAVFMAFQTVIIALLVLHYNGFSSWALAYLIGYTVAMVFLLFPLVPDQLLSFLQASVVFMVIISKTIQIRANNMNQSTGQISAITSSLIWLGALGRIFTSVQETGDMLMVAMYVSSAVCNTVLVTQVAYYWSRCTATRLKAD